MDYTNLNIEKEKLLIMKRRRLKVKPTKKWLKYVIADEKKANVDYMRHGFPKLAKQEAHHKKVLTKYLKSKFDVMRKELKRGVVQ